ncbi:MAG: UPF0182 family protein [Candidatus Saccharibacteria bacterium]
MESRSYRKPILVVMAIILVVFGSWLSNFTVKLQWFKSLSYGSVFLTSFEARWIWGIAVFTLVFIYLFANLMLTRKYSRHKTEKTEDGREIFYQPPPKWERLLKSKAVTYVFFAVSFVMAAMVASIAANSWMTVLRFMHSVSFNITDPIFGNDVSFYVFKLSCYQLIYNILMPLVIITTIAVGVVYLLTAAFDFTAVEWKEFNWPKAHIAILLTMIFALKAWGYKLDSYDLLYSKLGFVFGAGYTDVHARLIAYKILLIVSAVVGILLLLNMFIKRLNWVLYSVGAWLVLAFIFGVVYPGVVQKLSVEPNERDKERAYIAQNIKFTRAAYGLDKVDSKTFGVKYDLKWQDIQKNRDTVANIRLWDWQPLLQTYKAIQEIKGYYSFKDVDIDRYNINGQYRQVMLAAREMDQTGLTETAKRWQNQKLQYTHGYGIVMSPVNEMAQEGLPSLFIKDIPPRISADIKIDRPEIYYGETSDSYVFVKTGTKEFDYPSTPNQYTTYKEASGIKVGSFFNRLALAWSLGDYQILFSSEIKPESRVLLNRNVADRVKEIAPFLSYDKDPYLVVANGRLYWMLDAYTQTSMYPYSQPYGQDLSDVNPETVDLNSIINNRINSEEYNYIRNSVKVVVDAYNGNTTFYQADSTDPLIRSYASIFPGLFKPIEKMPASLRDHIRYPEDMFTIQTSMYSIYHMTDPDLIYSKEDKWNIPTEIFGSDRKTENVQPYYVIMQLPGESKPEFILMMPYTPKGKDNMIAWFCARSDQENYGKLKVFDFSKQEMIYGPMQVESRIDQNAEISQQLTLWSQKGSQVIRGNLLVIPVKNSIMYVEPIYLKAETSQIPELRRIIVAYGDQVVMQPTLQEALISIFGQNGQEPVIETPVPANPQETLSDIAKEAKTYYDQAQNSMKNGDWAGYGSNIKKVGDAINRIIEKSGSK